MVTRPSAQDATRSRLLPPKRRWPTPRFLRSAGRFDPEGERRAEPRTDASNDSPRKSSGSVVPGCATSTLTIRSRFGLVSPQAAAARRSSADETSRARTLHAYTHAITFNNEEAPVAQHDDPTYR